MGSDLREIFLRKMYVEDTGDIAGVAAGRASDCDAVKTL